MIDAVQLLLIDQPEELAIQLAGRGFIIPERFFDDHAAPAMGAVEQRRVGQSLGDFAVKARRGGEVKEEAVGDMPLRLELDELLPQGGIRV
jgi:hypothetical protein